MGVGPTGRRKNWAILVDECYRCGRQYAVNPDQLTYQQRDWLERWNKNVAESEPEPLPEPEPDTSGGLLNTNNIIWVTDFTTPEK